MKTVDQIKPNYAPVYCAALYPGLCQIFQRHGYALAVHGSLARDFDLIAVPWAEKISTPDEVIADMTSEYTLTVIDAPTRWGIKQHGRVACTVSCGFGECSIDLSFFPNANKEGA